MTRGTIRIGTSGWQYEHWTGAFYPEKLAKDERLEYYAERLPCVEINNTFYGTPEPATFDAWRSAVPEGFVFAVKASGYITHRKKLKDPNDAVPPFYDAVDRLGDRLGPILYQLPPRWSVNLERLESFLNSLPDPAQTAFEFRDRSWIVDGVRTMLARFGAAFCIYHLAGFRSPGWVTSDSLVYVRLHGPGDAYEGNYDRRSLAEWRDRIERWADEGRAVFVFFDNDQSGHAAENALQLTEMVRG